MSQADQMIEALVALRSLPAELEPYRTALQWLARLVRAEQCLAVEMDMQQVGNALSDHFEDD